MPTGIDQITPTYKVIGGGRDRGVYTVRIDFFTESQEYFVPESLTFEFTISAYEVEGVYYNTTFVYDGGVKCPEGYYLDIFGAEIPLSFEGGKTNAGDNYLAKAYINDENYYLKNDTVEFKIEKAYYNLAEVYWSSDGFTYNGQVHSVSVYGLPDGVEAVGYLDNIAIDAGEYFAEVRLIYDDKNYIKPQIEPYRWEIKKAEYDMTSVEVLGGMFEYSGDYYYPTILGEMPTGLDGYTLCYRILDGVRDVSVGAVSVGVEFFTESKNYNAPPIMYATVEVYPKEITVLWSDLSTVYNQKPQYPKAEAEECDIEVEVLAINAGEYTAKAKAKNQNYTVKNSSAVFVIQKAENYWTSVPSATDIFFGQGVKINGSPFYGDFEVEYYLDKELSRPINPPLEVGKYYACLVVRESENYEELRSEALSFEVKAVIAESIEFTLLNPILALSKIEYGDYVLLIKYNDGSVREAEHGEVEFVYENGSLPRGNDGKMTVVCLGISLDLSVTVQKAEYDLSGVYWDNLYYVYDGKEKTPSLLGLPQGVSVSNILGSATNAGEYIISATVNYDEENYNEPKMPTAKMTIAKRGITPSFQNSAIYNGEIIFPMASEDFLVPLCDGFRDAGEHLVAFELTDEKNYYLTTPYATFTIHPAPVEIMIKDKELYLFERVENIEYEINTHGKDISFNFDFHFEGDRIYARSEDGNILLSVTPGKLVRIFALSPTLGRAICISFILFVFFALLLAIIIRYKNKIFMFLRPAGVVEKQVSTPSLLGTGYLSVDLEHAERLLTDTIARTLLRKETEVIKTEGSKRVYINVDVLSEHFSPGDRIDINILKAKGLVPKDALTVKVLGRGMIDKPLFVYANSFSLSAVKMIALTGGEAHKVISENKNNDN